MHQAGSPFVIDVQLDAVTQHRLQLQILVIAKSAEPLEADVCQRLQPALGSHVAVLAALELDLENAMHGSRE